MIKERPLETRKEQPSLSPQPALQQKKTNFTSSSSSTPSDADVDADVDADADARAARAELINLARIKLHEYRTNSSKKKSSFAQQQTQQRSDVLSPFELSFSSPVTPVRQHYDRNQDRENFYLQQIKQQQLGRAHEPD